LPFRRCSSQIPTDRFGDTLSLINRDDGYSTSSLDRRLSEIQQSLSETHHAVLSQIKTVSPIPQSSSLNFGGQITYSLPWQPSRDFLNSAIDNATFQSYRSHSSTETLFRSREFEFKGSKRKPNLQAGLAHTSSGSVTPIEPESPFQILPCSFPEIYTIDQRLPISSLVVINFHQESSSSQWRRNFYRGFYLKSSRQWRRLTVEITIYRSSTYWAATKLSQFEYSTKDTLSFIGQASLPPSLLSQIQKFFVEAQDLDDDTHFRFFLSNKEIVQDQYCQYQIRPPLTTVELSIPCQEIITTLDDLGCPRYFENQLIQIAMVSPPDRFITCVNGMLVYEIKFARSLPSYEYLYNIQLLRCMDDVPGFAKLVGVVVNTSGNYLKSYLTGFLDISSPILSDKVVQGQLIPWKRREKLARQLIEAVRQVHFKGFVMGTLSCLRSRILIDSLNRLHFWEFKKKFIMGYRGGCYYPPEFRHYQYVSRSTAEAECPNVTTKTDIFHLGIVLWYISEGFPCGRVSPVCIRERCDTQSSCFCSDESHIDPIALPSLSESTPQYYRDIISDCRAEDPNERPAAWRLLGRFPSTSDSECSQIEDPEPKNTDLDYLLNKFARPVFCDTCRGWIEKSYFHCHICLSGDFDICLACYNHGLHCYERDHLLVEMEMEMGLTQSRAAGKYHSRVYNVSGTRNITEL
jgi:hypothetical protein